MTFVSLFAGIGGFDRGFDAMGWRAVAQVENDKACVSVLERHWPSVTRLGDIRNAMDEIPACDVLCGGDPCPSRSIAKGNRKSRSPDLAGWFLAVAGRLRPRWVVRENVRSPDAVYFAVGLDLLGYGVVALALDAKDFTGQSRRREFCVGCPPGRAAAFAQAVSDAAHAYGFVSSCGEETTPFAACITAHPCRMAAEDTYCYEPGRGLRVLSAEECEGLQGFPRGWTDGFSCSCRRRMIGRAVPPPMTEWIGRRIAEVNAAARR